MKPKKETIYIHPPYQNDLPLQLRMAGITHPDPAYHIYRPKESRLYVLEYVISGKGHVRHGDKTFSPSAGDVYFLQPYADSDYRADSKAPWEKIWFNMKGPLVEAFCQGYGLNGLTYFHNCPLRDLFFETLEVARQWKTGNYHPFSMQIHKIFSVLHDWKNNHPEFQKSPEGICLKEYIDLHWQENISLRTLADLIQKSPVQTIRIFQRDWGDTPNSYLQKQRLNFACQCLENTDYSVKEVASMLDFSDEFYFSNWFKERTGTAPTFYRNKFR